MADSQLNKKLQTTDNAIKKKLLYEPAEAIPSNYNTSAFPSQPAHPGPNYFSGKDEIGQTQQKSAQEKSRAASSDADWFKLVSKINGKYLSTVTKTNSEKQPSPRISLFQSVPYLFADD